MNKYILYLYLYLNKIQFRVIRVPPPHPRAHLHRRLAPCKALSCLVALALDLRHAPLQRSACRPGLLEGYMCVMRNRIQNKHSLKHARTHGRSRKCTHATGEPKCLRAPHRCAGRGRVARRLGRSERPLRRLRDAARGHSVCVTAAPPRQHAHTKHNRLITRARTVARAVASTRAASDTASARSAACGGSGHYMPERAHTHAHSAAFRTVARAFASSIARSATICERRRVTRGDTHMQSYATQAESRHHVTK